MAKRESSFKNMVITLLSVTGIAALSLGGVYNLTREPIAEAQKAKLQQAIGEVLPPFSELEEHEAMPADGPDPLVFYVARNADSIVGTAVRTYTDRGFSGRFTIMVGFLPDGTIHNTAVLEHKETPGLGDKMDIRKAPWSEQFRGKNPAEYRLQVRKDGGDVDAITAATISSRAFCDAVQRAYDTQQQKGGEKQ
ncbi:MAG TPA: RnfABCDGE type electron transport complex subunit G [Bacteroidales bacterium]|nr:RnfABCDGE type electron transport complex subunit G [Bacteroidales bacterium]